MDAKKYEYQSEFARRFYGQGVEAGIARGVERGRVELLLKQLTMRYGALSATMADKVRKASAAELDGMAERVLTAKTLDEAVGPR